MKMIYLDDALDGKIFSRDLREYVVPVRVLQSCQSVEPVEPVEAVEKNVEYKDMLKVLFNRCLALSSGQLCIFCGLRNECSQYRSVLKEAK